MKILLPLHSLSAPLSDGWATPLALMPLANGVVAGQMLESAVKAGATELLCLVPEQDMADEVEAWAAEALPGLEVSVAVSRAGGLFEAGWTARESWTTRDTSSSGILLLPGGRVLDVELAHLSDEAVDCVAISTPKEAGEPVPAGAFWFRDAAALGLIFSEAVSAGSRLSIGVERTILTGCERAGLRIGWREARLDLPLLDDGRPSAARLLDGNARLLSFGRSSAEAIERSYSEEFTVIPPVYIHEDATIESAIIASHTSVGAGATVRNAILHRCLVAAGAVVENVVLEGALIGENAIVSGALPSLILPDGHTHAG